MIERVLLSAVVIGVVAFICFHYLLSTGITVESARNGTLLLMVLFENIHVMNSRSETKSVLQQSLFQNKLLIISVIGAQVLHFVAMNVPMLSEILEINPVSPIEWSQYLFISLSLLIVSEIYKKYRSMKPYN